MTSPIQITWHLFIQCKLLHVTLAIIGLIENSGGSHFGADMRRTGYSGLGSAVLDLGLDTEELPEVDIVVCFTLTDNRQLELGTDFDRPRRLVTSPINLSDQYI